MAYEGLDELGRTMLENSRRMERRENAYAAFKNAAPATEAVQRPTVLARLRGAAPVAKKLTTPALVAGMEGYNAYSDIVNTPGYTTGDKVARGIEGGGRLASTLLGAKLGAMTPYPVLGAAIGGGLGFVAPNMLEKVTGEPLPSTKAKYLQGKYDEEDLKNLSPEILARLEGNLTKDNAERAAKREAQSQPVVNNQPVQPNIVMGKAPQEGRAVLAETLLKSALANMEKYADPNRQLGTGRGLRELANLQAQIAGGNINATPESIAKINLLMSEAEAPDIKYQEIGGGLEPKQLVRIDNKTGQYEVLDIGQPGAMDAGQPAQRTPNQQALLYLKNNPDTLQDFIQKYGESNVPDWAKKQD